MLIMGGNPAENHPCGFKWAIEAKRQRNAKMIVVDPRFTRTAATADLFLQIRAGSDIAFLGGMIQLRHREQPHRARLPGQLHQRGVHRPGGFKLPEDEAVLGLRCGHARLYDRATLELRRSGAGREGAGATISRCENPRSVFQLLKQQYSRYTPEMVERITGIPQGPVPESRRPVHLHPQGRRHEEGRAPSSTRWAGRSTAPARRPSARRRCCSCCWATWDAPAAA